MTANCVFCRFVSMTSSDRVVRVHEERFIKSRNSMEGRESANRADWKKKVNSCLGLRWLGVTISYQ